GGTRQRVTREVGDPMGGRGGGGAVCGPGYSPAGGQADAWSITKISPPISLALAKAGMARDFDTLDELMAKYVHPLYAIRERVKGYEVSVMKAAMDILGMPAGPVRPPLQECTERDLADIRRLLDVYRSFDAASLEMAVK